MRRLALLLGGVLAGVVPGPAQAQAYQCRVDNAPVSYRPVTPDGPVRRMPVTGYTLALSWAPEYCRGRAQRAGDTVQCSGRHGRFGLVVHGLWPEGGDGRWPQWCPTPRQPSPAQLRSQLCMMPSAQLQARQWAKHGACMVRSPESYFRVTRILWNSVEPRLPDLDRLSRGDGLTASKLRAAFVAAHPAWRADQIGIRLGERGWLREIRLCYGTDFRPARCTPQQHGARDAASVRIWRGL